jgi:hypothetical protein
MKTQQQTEFIKNYSNFYAPLFDLLYKKHRIIMLDCEMDEIIDVSRQMIIKESFVNLQQHINQNRSGHLYD